MIITCYQLRLLRRLAKKNRRLTEAGDKITGRSLMRRKWATFSDPDRWEMAITDSGRTTLATARWHR